MTRRGEILTAIALVVAMALNVLGYLAAVFDDVGIGTFLIAQGCMLLITAVYLEVYSQRG